MVDDLHFGRPELLARAADRAVLAGKLTESAAADVVALFAQKCVVDSTLKIVTLNGKSLDEGLADEIAARPHWQPVEARPEIAARADLEARAMSGNVSAHGLLMRELGQADYAAWCKKHGAAPGKKVEQTNENAADQKAKEDRRGNPWSREGWNVSRQGVLVRTLGVAKAAEIARAAGGRIGATRPA